MSKYRCPACHQPVPHLLKHLLPEGESPECVWTCCPIHAAPEPQEGGR